MKKVTAWLALFALTTALFAGCTPKDKAEEDKTPTVATENVKEPEKKPVVKVEDKKKDPVELVFFTGKVETVDMINDMIATFNSENPDSKVEQEFQKDASNVIKVKFASNDIPDITTVVAQDYIDQGKYVDLSNEAWWDRVQPSIKDLCTDIKSGKQYKIATNMTMAGLFYNKEMFNGMEEAKTWADFEANLAKVKEANPDVAPFFMGGKDSWMLGHLIEFMPHGVVKQKYGVEGSRKAFLDNDDEKLMFGSEEGPMAAFATSILSLRDKNLINEDLLTATYDNQLDAFAYGEAAMISQGMWAVGGILERDPEMATKIGFMPYPAIIDGLEPVILSAEDSAYAITSDGQHIEESKKFLSHLFKAENLKAYSEFVKSPCAFKDVEADWGPLKAEVAKALENGVHIGFTNEGPSGFSGDDAGRMVQELYAGKYTTALDFAKAYKETWDNAWVAGQ